MFNSFQLNFKTKFHNKTPKVFCLTFGVHVTFGSPSLDFMFLAQELADLA